MKPCNNIETDGNFLNDFDRGHRLMPAGQQSDQCFFFMMRIEKNFFCLIKNHKQY